MTRPLRYLLCALVLGGPLNAGCTSILGDYTIVDSDGSGGAGSAGVTASTVVTGGSVGGSSSSGPGSSDSCGLGTTGSMKDNFNSNSGNWTVVTGDGHISAALVNNRLEVTTDGTPGAAGGYQWAQTSASLVGCHVSVEVDGIESLGNGISVRFNLVANADSGGMMNEMRIEKRGMQLEAHVWSNGKELLVGKNYDVPFDATKMRRWRMRETKGMLVMEYSPDNMLWTPLATTTMPLFAFAIRPQLFIAATGLMASPGSTATFDNLNTD